MMAKCLSSLSVTNTGFINPTVISARITDLMIMCGSRRCPPGKNQSTGNNKNSNANNGYVNEMSMLGH